MKKVLIIHGWESNSKEHWFLKEKEKLEKLGYEVSVPDMPNSFFPKEEEWVQIIKDFDPDENSVLIGHSLGGTAILRYLEGASKKAGNCIFIATPIRKLESKEEDFSPVYNFFESEINYQKIKQNCNNFYILNQTNDPYVPLQHGKDLADSIGGELKMIKGNDHFDKIEPGYLLDKL